MPGAAKTAGMIIMLCYNDLKLFLPALQGAARRGITNAAIGHNTMGRMGGLGRRPRLQGKEDHG
jgi:hypothetical protein